MSEPGTGQSSSNLVHYLLESSASLLGPFFWVRTKYKNWRMNETGWVDCQSLVNSPEVQRFQNSPES